jgi:hypothetical protein
LLHQEEGKPTGPPLAFDWFNSESGKEVLEYLEKMHIGPPLSERWVHNPLELAHREGARYFLDTIRQLARRVGRGG